MATLTSGGATLSGVAGEGLVLRARSNGPGRPASLTKTVPVRDGRGHTEQQEVGITFDQVQDGALYQCTESDVVGKSLTVFSVKLPSGEVPVKAQKKQRSN
jgi:hypothetical protein